MTTKIIPMGDDYIKIFTSAKERRGKKGKKYFKYFCKTCKREIKSIKLSRKIVCKYCGHIAFINKNIILTKYGKKS